MITPLMRALFRLARRAWGLFPLSLAGICCLGAGYWAFKRWGKAHGDYVLYDAGIMAMALVAVCALLVVLGAAWVFWRVRGHIEDDHVVVDAGHELITGFAFPSLRFVPLLRVSMVWDEPAGAAVTLLPQGAGYLERLVFLQRGRVARVVRVFTVSDVFGIARLGFAVGYAADLRISPALGQAALSINMRMASGEGISHPSGDPVGEMIEMRRYAQGDPLRFVLWKTYARTRRLLVRAPERAIVPQPKTVAYLVAGPQDEASASTARTLLEGHGLGREVVFAADGAAEPVATDGEAVELLIGSASHKHRGGQDLARLLTSLDRVQLGNVVLFTPAEPGPWLETIAAFTKRLPAPPTIVVGVDDLEPAKKRGRLSRLLRFSAEPGPDSLRALKTVVLALQGLGAQVRLVHRPSGRIISDVEFASLTEAT